MPPEISAAQGVALLARLGRVAAVRLTANVLFGLLKEAVERLVEGPIQSGDKQLGRILGDDIGMCLTGLR